MPRPMTDEEWRAFVMEGTRTGNDVVFTTGATSVKGRTLRRNPRASLSVDDQAPPYSFVTIEGTVSISEDRDDLRRFATLIGGRYMGAGRAEEFGARNAVEGELLVRLHPAKVLAEAGVAD